MGYGRDVNILYDYIVTGYTQEVIGQKYGISTGVVSILVRNCGFNTEKRDGFRSGQHKGKYKEGFRGIKVTHQHIAEYMGTHFDSFEDFLIDQYETTSKAVNKRHIIENGSFNNANQIPSLATQEKHIQKRWTALKSNIINQDGVLYNLFRTGFQNPMRALVVFVGILFIYQALKYFLPPEIITGILFLVVILSVGVLIFGLNKIFNLTFSVITNILGVGNRRVKKRKTNRLITNSFKLREVLWILITIWMSLVSYQDTQWIASLISIPLVSITIYFTLSSWMGWKK